MQRQRTSETATLLRQPLQQLPFQAPIMCIRLWQRFSLNHDRIDLELGAYTSDQQFADACAGVDDDLQLVLERCDGFDLDVVVATRAVDAFGVALGEVHVVCDGGVKLADVTIDAKVAMSGRMEVAGQLEQSLEGHDVSGTSVRVTGLDCATVGFEFLDGMVQACCFNREHLDVLCNFERGRCARRFRRTPSTEETRDLFGDSAGRFDQVGAFKVRVAFGAADAFVTEQLTRHVKRLARLQRM